VKPSKRTLKRVEKGEIFLKGLRKCYLENRMEVLNLFGLIGEGMSKQPDQAEVMFCRLLVHNKLVEESKVQALMKDRGAWSQPSLPEEVVARGLVKSAVCDKVRGAVEAKGLQFPVGFADEPESAAAPVGESNTGSSASSASPAPSKAQGVSSSFLPEDSDLIPSLPSQPKGLGKKVISLLKSARQNHASDLHISVGTPALMRVRGVLSRMDTPEFSAEETKEMLMDLLIPSQLEKLEADLQLDFSLLLDDGSRCRSNIVKERTGWVGCFRLVPDHIPSFEELGLPDQVKTLTEYPTGLVLVTGPMGSGKTTTLAAMLDLINQKRKDHIITVEDPIEFKHPSKGCQVTQRSLGSHTKSFANALKGALRQDPDIIMIGELRDLETISIAITAAETGHLVLGSLHTNSAERTIDRLVSSFPPDQQSQIRVMIADSIRGIVCQQLVPNEKGDGVELALEILMNNTSVRKMIVDNRTFQLESVLQTGKKQGMVRMDDSILELLNKGLITKDVAKVYLRNPGVVS
jgi:twitching motility protein PilT